MRRACITIISISILFSSCASKGNVHVNKINTYSRPTFEFPKFPKLESSRPSFSEKPYEQAKQKVHVYDVETKKEPVLNSSKMISKPKAKTKKEKPAPFLRIATNTMAKEGTVMIRKKQLDKASDHFEKVINIDPSNPKAYYYLGVINFRKKQYKQSILFFKKSYMLYDRNSAKKALTLYQIGYSYKAMKLPEKAKKYFNLSKKENPKNAFADPLMLSHRDGS